MKQQRLALLLEREGSCQTLRRNCLHLGTTKNPQDLVISLRKSWLKNPLEPPARNIGSNRLFAMKLHPYFLEIIIILFCRRLTWRNFAKSRRNHGEFCNISTIFRIVQWNGSKCVHIVHKSGKFGKCIVAWFCKFSYIILYHLISFCRSRNMPQNETSLVKFGVDISEDEPDRADESSRRTSRWLFR